MIYESIEDLPLWNWNKVQERSDYTYLRMNRINSNATPEEQQELKKVWEKLFAEFIDCFKFSAEFKDQVMKEEEIAILINQKIQTGDKSINYFIELAKRELEAMKPKESSVTSFWQTKSAIQRLVGYRIDAKNTTVMEFYSEIELLKKEKKLQ